LALPEAIIPPYAGKARGGSVDNQSYVVNPVMWPGPEVSCLCGLYVAKDNETHDRDSETHAKVIETGMTKLLRLEYTTDLCQS